MRSEFITAINQVCAERNLSQHVVIEAVEAALVSAYKRNFGSSENIRTKLDPHTGRVQVFAEKEIVESVKDPKTEISLEEAREIRPTAELGETVSVETTPKDFGRIAAQTAKQVILQRIREAERDVLYDAYADREGELITGTVQSIDHQGIILNLGKAEAALPRSEQIPSEHMHQNQRVKAYVVEVNKTNKGPQIVVSRTHRNMLRRLLETEVPEIFNGTVEIKQIAREPGSRSKVAVAATQEGVDPVGSCVGMRGVRIQNIVNELNGEKIDVVQWSPDVATFIANALSPAKVMNVTLCEESDGSKTAVVVVPDRQLSLAIGKEGQNARLAAKLTGWRIDIKSASEAAEEMLTMVSSVPTAAQPALSAEDILAKAEAILKARPEPEAAEVETEIMAALPLTEEEAMILAEEMQQEVDEPQPIEAVAEMDEADVPGPAEDEFEKEIAAGDQAMPEPEGELMYQEEVAGGTYYSDEELFYEEGEEVTASKKKKDRKRKLVFDENSGRLIAKKVHKPGRIRDWGELVEDE